MDLLITVIGNAVADPIFRAKLLENPLQAIDDWGFRLTKREVGVLEGMFAELNGENRDLLARLFKPLEDILYKNLEEASSRNVAMMCNTKRCPVSLYPQTTELRAEVRKAAMEEFERIMAA